MCGWVIGRWGEVTAPSPKKEISLLKETVLSFLIVFPVPMSEVAAAPDAILSKKELLARKGLVIYMTNWEAAVAT